MDSITKFLLKLSLSERQILLQIIQQIIALQLDGLDVKKLTGKENYFRVRKWKIRIIFKKEGNIGNIIDVHYRGGVYKKL